MSEIVIITIFFHSLTLLMRSIDILLINGEPANGHDVIKIVEEGSNYFPSDTWDNIEYRAKFSSEHDVTIVTGGESFGAFLFEKLTKKIGRIRCSNGFKNLLLGITQDPIIAIYYYIDGRRFKRTLHLIHDFVDRKIGVVSLFQINEQAARKVVAHGLGHNKGLRHHQEPVDLMYSGLLRTQTLQVEGFCEGCLHKLTENENDT